MGDPHDRRTWSGTPYYAMQQIGPRVSEFRVLETPRLDRWLKKVNGAVRRLGRDLTRNPLVTRLFARAIERQLEQFRPDVILAVGGAYKLARIRSSVPIVFVSDALFCSIVDYYAKFRRMDGATRQRSMALEGAFLKPANRRLALMSQWAADTAIAAHGIAPDRVRVVPIGANLDADPGRRVLDTAKDRLILLWIGVDWERKGGRLLLESFGRIRERHPEAELHIVGMDPAEAHGRDGVTVHGFLRKSVPEERGRLLALFERSALYVMLSAEEAFGLVYCEAAAFGVPSIGYRTGGVTTIVKDGETGLLLPLEAGPEEVADAVDAIWLDQPRYASMRAAARKRYEDVLNWNVWGDAVLEELTKASRMGGNAA